MIEFKALIHKPTEQVFKYEDWVNMNNNKIYTFNIAEYKDNKEIDRREWIYTKLEMLLSDDFEIVYNNEFTKGEYFEILSQAIQVDGNILIKDKTKNKLKYIEELKYKYNLEG